MTAHIARLPGNRLHCQHGPIDLVIAADGAAFEVERAFAAAADVFPGILPRLVEELGVLRTPVGRAGRADAAAPSVHGPVARRMVEAVWPFAEHFITPMAAVAGAVAEEVLAVMTAAARLERAAVNNGGDIAIHLGADATYDLGIVGDVAAPTIDATIRIAADDDVRGIATSGWRGRSQSLGIADAVTVLARTAAQADAAATMIANAVDAAHPAIARRPAREVKVDSDLGDFPVTVAVNRLPAHIRAAALDRGVAYAEGLAGKGLVVAACLHLQGEARVVGGLRTAVPSGCRKVEAIGAYARVV